MIITPSISQHPDSLCVVAEVFVEHIGHYLWWQHRAIDASRFSSV